MIATDVTRSDWVSLPLCALDAELERPAETYASTAGLSWSGGGKCAAGVGCKQAKAGSGALKEVPSVHESKRPFGEIGPQMELY